MTKKEKINILTTLGVLFLVVGQFAIYLFMEVCGITVTYNTGLAYNIGQSIYLTYAVLFMVYMVFFICMEENGNQLHFNKKLLKRNILAMISIEMFLFMVTFFNFIIFHPEILYGAYIPEVFTDVIHLILLSYIALMIGLAVVAYILREIRRSRHDA